MGRSARPLDFSGETQVEFGNAGDFDRDQPLRSRSGSSLADPTQDACTVLAKDGTGPSTGPAMNWARRRHIHWRLQRRPARDRGTRWRRHWPTMRIEVRTKERVRQTAPIGIICWSTTTVPAKLQASRFYVDGHSRADDRDRQRSLGGSRSAPRHRSKLATRSSAAPFKGPTRRPAHLQPHATDAGDRRPGRSSAGAILLIELAGMPAQEIDPPAREAAEETEIGEQAKAEISRTKSRRLEKQIRPALSEYFLKCAAPEK